MHYSALVFLEGRPENVEEKVAAVLAPRQGDEWDWYQIGGRWSGHLSGYDPEKDPANTETCNLCQGTGQRPGALEQFGAAWVKEMKGCNGCLGKGTRVKWPTQWQRHDGDVRPVEDLTDAHLQVHAVICEGRGWYTSERYEPWHSELSQTFPKQDLPPRAWLQEEYAGGLVVIVDYHN